MPEARAWGAARILAATRWGPLRRALMRPDPSRALPLAVFGLLGLLFEAFLYGIFRAWAAALWAQPGLGPKLGARALGASIDLVGALAALTTLPGLLNRLAESGDAAFYAASPMDPRVYLRLRLAETTLGSAAALAALWVPAALALAPRFGGGAVGAFLTLAAPLPAAALGSALGAACLCAALQALPPRRVRAALSALGALMLGAFVAALVLVRPENLLDPSRSASAAAYLRGLGVLDRVWLPGYWAARWVDLAARAPFAALAGWAAGLIPAAACLVWVVAAHGPGAFGAWDGGDGAGRGGRGGIRPAFGGSRIRRAWRVHLEHGRVELTRAPGQAAQALLLAALLALFAAAMLRLPLGRDQQLKDWVLLPAVFCAQALLTAVSARFVYPAASLRQGGAWLTLQTPAKPSDRLRADAVLAAGLLLPLAGALDLLLARVFTPPPGVACALAAASLAFAASLAGLHSGLGQAWASPADHPEAALASARGILAAALGLLLAAAADLGTAPLLRSAYLGRPAGAWEWAVAALGPLIAAAAAVLALRAGAGRLEDGGD